MARSLLLLGVVVFLGAGCRSGEAPPPASADAVLVPAVDGAWWQVAGNPDLGALTTDRQQPVDFGIWQAADGTWQLWSCIRHTNEPGNTRLFHRWEGARLTDTDWTPMGIAMQADTMLGETAGGLQAPYVRVIDGVYHMFYGDWRRIALARSTDGKRFERVLRDGSPALFGDPAETNTRDVMVLPINGTWYAYYTAHPGNDGAVYARTSPDLTNWSDSKIVAYGGQAGKGELWFAECPFVIRHDDAFYLFRTQSYGRGLADSLENHQKTSVYRSRDPLDFGVDDDRYFVGTLPVAAPEFFEHEGQWYVAALTSNLQGIRIARLKWVPEGQQADAF